MWYHTHNPSTGEIETRDQKFKVSMGYIAGPSLKKLKKLKR
jgi:hypothetical protein